MAAGVLLPGGVLSMTSSAAERLVRSGSGDAALLYLQLLRQGGQFDAEGVRTILAEEYRKSGFAPEQVDTGAVIITGETARKENAREVLSALSQFAGDFVVATAGPDLESILAARGAGADEYSREHHTDVLHLSLIHI